MARLGGTAMRDHSIERTNLTEFRKSDRLISTPPLTAEEMHAMRRMMITGDPVRNTDRFAGTVLSESEPFPQIRRNTDGSYEVLGIAKNRGTARHYLLRIDEAGHITVRPIMQSRQSDRNHRFRLCF